MASIDRSRLAVFTVDHNGTIISYELGRLYSEKLLIENPVGLNAVEFLSTRDIPSFYNTLNRVLLQDVIIPIKYEIVYNSLMKTVHSIFVPDVLQNTVDIYEINNFYGS